MHLVCLFVVMIAATFRLAAQSHEPFLPAAGLPFARERAIAETQDTSAALVTIRWMKYRSDSLQSGTFDLQGNGSAPMWDYAFLSPMQQTIHLFTIVSSGGTFSVVGHRQWPIDTSRIIDKQWYDVDSLMRYIQNLIIATGWKQTCPSIELVGIRLVMIYDRYVSRSYIPMWGAEWWCIPQRYKVECFHDAYRRAITICTDTSSLINSVAECNARTPSTEKFLLNEPTLPFHVPLSQNATVRVFDISGRLIEEQQLTAGSEFIRLPESVTRGFYRILATDVAGTIIGSWYVIFIE
jgi:hypothetical protein